MLASGSIGLRSCCGDLADFERSDVCAQLLGCDWSRISGAVSRMRWLRSRKPPVAVIKRVRRMQGSMEVLSGRKCGETRRI